MIHISLKLPFELFSSEIEPHTLFSLPILIVKPINSCKDYSYLSVTWW